MPLVLHFESWSVLEGEAFSTLLKLCYPLCDKMKTSWFCFTFTTILSEMSYSKPVNNPINQLLCSTNGHWTTTRGAIFDMDSKFNFPYTFHYTVKNNVKNGIYWLTNLSILLDKSLNRVINIECENMTTDLCHHGCSTCGHPIQVNVNIDNKLISIKISV